MVEVQLKIFLIEVKSKQNQNSYQDPSVRSGLSGATKVEIRFFSRETSCLTDLNHFLKYVLTPSNRNIVL